MARKVSKTKYYSRLVGKLPKGCRQCVKGEKLVMFVTGACPKRCFYCPVSDKKRYKDVTYANEWHVGNIDFQKMMRDVIKEAELCKAKGMGITGGDPLSKIDRTVKIIKSMKRRFGGGFHAHLYTSPVSLTKKKLDMLHKAGLDELRMHPDIYDKKYWAKMKMAAQYGWVLGVEIPVIPGAVKKTIEMIVYIKDDITFLNLNEMEISEDLIENFWKRKLLTKDKISYAVKGSEEAAQKILMYCAKNTSLDVHYCTAKLKDKVQMTERIKRRAKSIRKKFDVLLEDGLLERGAFYPTQKKVDAEVVKQLASSMRSIIKEYGVPKSMIELDPEKGRILTSPIFIRKLAKEGLELRKIKKQRLIPAVVKEYPTKDGFIVEKEGF